MTDKDIVELHDHIERWLDHCNAGATTAVTTAQIALLKQLRPTGDTDG